MALLGTSGSPAVGFRRPLTWLLAALILGGRLAAAESLEYRIKAAFLYNFAKFVAWPQSPLEREGVFTLCVLGSDPFGAALEATTRGKKVHGNPLVLRWIANARQAAGCRMLFISASERQRFREILGEIRGTEILTVSETPGFAEQGGMINFFLEDDKVRFEINQECALQAGLRISAQLLQLARLVGAQTAEKR